MSDRTLNLRVGDLVKVFSYELSRDSWEAGILVSRECQLKGSPEEERFWEVVTRLGRQWASEQRLEVICAEDRRFSKV
jgi:hypothetical protein